MHKTKKIVTRLALSVVLFSLYACGKGSNNADIYGKTIAELEDDELFAIIDTNAPLPVLLVTSHAYDDGNGNQTTIECDVYYLADKEVKTIETLESMGTAYPISYDEKGIYTASGHTLHRFEIDHSGTMTLAEAVYEQFDKTGTPTYTMETKNESKVITVKEYDTAFENYSNAAVVNFTASALNAVQ